MDPLTALLLVFIVVLAQSLLDTDGDGGGKLSRAAAGA
jgi:hypothetical protein